VRDFVTSLESTCKFHTSIEIRPESSSIAALSMGQSIQATHPVSLEPQSHFHESLVNEPIQAPPVWFSRRSGQDPGWGDPSWDRAGRDGAKAD